MEIKRMNAQTRSDVTKPGLKECRNKGFIPAIMYGGDGESCPIKLDQKEWTKLFNDLGSGNLIIDLIIDDTEENPELIKVGDVQWHPFEAKVLHVDLIRLARGVLAEFEVPVILTGKSDGEKAGGVLSKHINYILIKSMPRHVPESIEIDISSYELNSKMYVRDIKYSSDNVEIVADDDELIFTIDVPKLVLETTDDESEETAEGEEGSEKEKSEE